MKVYKYRSNYKRDLENLLNGKIYTSNMAGLNDPFEGIITPKIFEDYETIKSYFDPKQFEYKISLHKKLIDQIKNVGIYSLSKTWKKELLWSHYSDSHKGFCIEYEINDLILEESKSIIFPKIINVNYLKEPPIYSLQDSDNLDYKILQTLAGTKSKPWKYEKEIRIIFMEYGEKKINTNAIISIIFGLHASDEDINHTMKLLEYNIKYYKIELQKNSYKLTRKRI